MELRLEAAQASDRLWKYAMDHKEYMPDENQYEPDFLAYEAGETLHYYAQGADIDIEDVLEALELDKQLHVIEEDDPFTKAEDYGIVKYTKGGLYDYGYNPSVDPEELPF